VISGSDECAVRLWDTNTGKITHLRQFEGHTRGVLGVINVPGGQRIITCSADGSLRVWNLKTGLPIGKAWQDGESEVYAIALSPDRKKVVSGDRDVVVKLWNVDTGKVVAKWTGHTEEVRSVCWSRDGLRVLSGSSDGSARVWDAESGETILGPMETGMFLVAVSYSPDETLIAAGGYRYDGSSVNIFDAKTGKLVTTLGHEDMVNCLAWTADGNTLISGSTDRLIRVWNTTTWKNIAVWPEHHAKSVDGITISPNGRILATASWPSSDRTAQLWNLDNGQLISSPLKHSDVVLCVSFSTDGKLLTTGCDDHSAYTWDVSAIVKEAGLGDLLSHSDVSEYAFPNIPSHLQSRHSLGLAGINLMTQ
ncbi:WD40 repeat-like protein, partial [Rhizopogon vinicolor AM-OR11-026]